MDASNAIFISLISTLAGGTIGYGLYNTVKPKNGAKTPHEFGRLWLAYILFIVSLITLGKIFIHFDIDTLLKFSICAITYGIIAYIFGYLYGYFFKNVQLKKHQSSHESLETKQLKAKKHYLESELEKRNLEQDIQELEKKLGYQEHLLHKNVNEKDVAINNATILSADQKTAKLNNKNTRDFFIALILISLITLIIISFQNPNLTNDCSFIKNNSYEEISKKFFSPEEKLYQCVQHNFINSKTATVINDIASESDLEKLDPKFFEAGKNLEIYNTWYATAQDVGIKITNLGKNAFSDFILNYHSGSCEKSTSKTTLLHIRSQEVGSGETVVLKWSKNFNITKGCLTIIAAYN